MRLLLDTHIWLWSWTEPRRLGRRTAQEIASPRNEIWLSPVSIWEIQTLVRKGRVSLDDTPGRWMRRAFEEVALHDAPITREVALELDSTNLDHDDPGDRLLVATARVYDLTLVTADARLLRCQGLKVLAG